MNSISSEALIDLIYEAAVVPELWPSVLHKMAMATDSVGGILFAVNRNDVHWMSSPNIRDGFGEFLRDGWAQRNPRMERMALIDHAGFLRDNDCLTPEEMDNDPVYTQFWRKRGLGWCAGTRLVMPTGDAVVFSIERAFAKGPVEMSSVAFLDGLRPHLARASLLSARLGLEKARAMMGMLANLKIPGAVLRGDGQMLAANPMFESLMPGVIMDRRERVTLADDGGDALLSAALGRLRYGIGAKEVVSSIPIAAIEGHPPMIVHILPIRGAAHDLFNMATALMIVTPVDRGAVPQASVLQGLFDLTPAEARVARGIGESKTVEELATASGVSKETVRSQLKSVLFKTGVNRQSELVGLLAGTPRISPLQP